MTSDFIKFEEDPKELWTQIKRTLKLLLLIVALVLLDGFNRHFSINYSYEQLPGVLYDFTVKYREPLSNWYQDNDPSASQFGFGIRFEKRYAEKQLLDPGYFNIAEVPFLDAYLKDHLPALASGNRRFLGYEMTFQMYVLLVLTVPSILLFSLAWHLSRLRHSWVSSAPSSSRFCDDLPFLSSGKRRKVIGTMKSITAVTVILLTTILSSISLIAFQINLQPNIKGELCIEPVTLPKIQDAYTYLLVNPSDSLLWFMILTFILDLIIFGFILRIILRRE